MTVGIIPVFKPGDAVIPSGPKGVLILRHYEVLDAIADINGLDPLSGFGDNNRDIPADFVGTPDELAARLGPWEDWFPIESGLRSVEGLIEFLVIHPSAVDESRHVLEELRELARRLRAALPEGAQFRLEVG